MKTQGIFIARPGTLDQVNALQAFMQALKIKFEVSREENYNPEFVEKILKSQQEIENGEVIRVEKENLKEFLGL
jgi:hypothetical protein